MGWEPVEGASIAGDVRVLRGALDRELVAYLPPSHGSGARFPVLYMHDAQNLFDRARSNSGEWRVDETMELLAAEGIEAIVVGLPHAGDARGAEYAGDGAGEYLDLLVGTVVPLVESQLDADGRRGVAGSSLGGVASLHALYRHPGVFAFAGVFSPAFWWNGDDRWFELAEREPAPDARIYLDVGDDEWNDAEDTRRAYVEGFERMRDLLRHKGLGEDRLRAVLEPGGRHHEDDWARRLPGALRFLLGPEG